MNGRKPLKLLYAIGDGMTAVITSLRRLQQGFDLSPLDYNAGGVKILEEFEAAPPTLRAQTITFIDDIAVLLLPEVAFDLAGIAKTMGWVPTLLLKEGTTLNRSKWAVIFLCGVRADDLTAGQRTESERTDLTDAGGTMR